MRLSELTGFKNIIIQCHDNPDADAIGSGYALYTYFKSKDMDVRFIYSGRFEITKSNLLYLVDTLNIPIEYVENLDTVPDLLLTTDCQYNEGNVRHFDAANVAVIDHHQVSGKLPELFDVRPATGSCCTIIWDLLNKEDFELDRSLSTALYYGLYTDTNGLTEVSHPLDKDMLEKLSYDRGLVRRLSNMNISLTEAKIAGIALIGAEFHEEHRYALIESEPCDPNLLGLISDFFLSVDTVDYCFVFSLLQTGIKFSVRSCYKEVLANELAQYMSAGIGSGGGHVDKAGGFIQYELLKKEYPRFADAEARSQGAVCTDIFRQKLYNYFTETDIVYAGETAVDMSSAETYQKIPVRQGYVHPGDLVPEGTPVMIRTLEGDMNLEATADNVFVIGVTGEVYASNSGTFEKNYTVTDEPYDLKLEYEPTMKNMITGETIQLADNAHICVSNEGNRILAKRLTRPVKVFTKWYPDEYLKGEPGDFIAAKEYDPEDVYVINKKIFAKSYKKV